LKQRYQCSPFKSDETFSRKPSDFHAIISEGTYKRGSRSWIPDTSECFAGFPPHTLIPARQQFNQTWNRWLPDLHQGNPRALAFHPFLAAQLANKHFYLRARIHGQAF
jgi:hypothetical protein